MILKKSGHQRHHGFTELANAVFTYVAWSETRLLARVSGQDGNSTYDFDMHFSADELAELVETALKSGTNDLAIHCHGKGIGAFIREALSDNPKAS